MIFDVARCARCGCTEDAPCPGGCFWVPPEVSGEMADICSACCPTASGRLVGPSVDPVGSQ